MSFKIVQTIDGGKYVLTTVPESWENKGNLRWPKHNSEILRCDSYSIPEDNWLSTNCIVKRKNIKGFEEAENELKAMSEMSTDQETITKQLQNKLADIETDFKKLARHFFGTQICKPSSASKIRFASDQTSQSAVDSNEMILSKNNARRNFVTCRDLDFSSDNSEPEVVQPVQHQESRDEDVLSPKTENINLDPLSTHTQEDTCQEIREQQVCVGNMDNLMTSTTNLSTKLTTLETKIDNFIASSSKTQMSMSLNQEQIMQKLSEISAKLDGYIKRSSTLHLNQSEDLNRVLKSICNEESLNTFEESLKNNETMDEMVKLYSVVCGKGKGSAINNAYALSDAMFDRHFLNQCSWAGGSRGETSKLCFKSYKRTINLFFKVIHASDNQFTLLECESFLKNILRNAKKRSEAKQLKCSAEKKRPRKHKQDET